MAELSVKVPIKFSEKAQRDLYEMCMAYKELAEVRGAENEKLRECLQDFADAIKNDDGFGVDQGWMLERMQELGIEVGE